MVFVCSKTAISHALKVASRGVKLRSPLPVTQCVRFWVAEEGPEIPVSLYSTDTEIAIHTQLMANVKQAGEVCVPMKRFLEIVSSLPNQELKFTCDDALRISITSGRSVFRLSGVDARDMPVVRQIADDVGLTISEGLLYSMFAKTVYAAAKDDTRPRLTGACLTLADNRMELAATDAHILAIYSQEFSESLNRELRVIIPRETLLEFLNLAEEDSDRSASLWIDENALAIQVRDHWLASRLIVGDYPKYWSFVPESVETSVVIARDSFIDSLKRVQIIARDNLNKVVCKFEPDYLSLETSYGDNCFTEELVTTHDGKPIEIVLNVSQTLSILSSFEGENIFVGMNDPLKPVLFRSMESDDYFSVGMPMNPS